MLLAGIVIATRAVIAYVVPALKKVDEAAQLEEGQRPPQVRCFFEYDGKQVDSVRLRSNEDTEVAIGLETDENKMTVVVVDVCFQPPLEPSRTDNRPLLRRPPTDPAMPGWPFYSINRNVWNRRFFWKQTFSVRCGQPGQYEVRIIGQSVSHQDFEKVLNLIVEPSSQVIQG